MRTLLLLIVAGLTASCYPDGNQAGNRPPTPWVPPPVQAGAGAGVAGGAGFGGTIGVDNPMGTPAGSPAMNVAGIGGNDAGTQDAGATDAALTPDNSCGKGKTEAKLKPVNMFVMFDRSGSMDDDDKWTDASAALTSFFRDPKVAGMRVALRFFPHELPVDGCARNDCDAEACAQPLVALGELNESLAPADTQEDALVRAVAASEPGGLDGGGTPIFAALDGALRWSTTYAAAHADESTVVVFVTDGEPNGCNEDFDEIAALAAGALARSGVPTYAIGLDGSSTAQMNQLAQAGGTKHGIFIGTGASAEQELISALNSIRGQALSCDFPMPAPTDPSMTIDPKRVNVTYTPSNGAPGTLAQVEGQPACGTNKSWYYDTPQNPTRIHLCPAACDLVRKDSKPVLEVLLGCATACGGLDVSCGGEPPPPDVPPIVF